MNDFIGVLILFMILLAPFPVFIGLTIASKLKLMKLSKKIYTVLTDENQSVSFLKRVPKIEAVYKGFPVTVEFPRATPKTQRIRMRLQHNMKYNIQIKSKRRVSSIVRRYVRGNIVLGDNNFDRFFFVNGNKADLLLFCNIHTRSVLMQLMGPSISFAFSEKEFDSLLCMNRFNTKEVIEDYLNQITALCDLYSKRKNTFKTIIENLETENVYDVKGTIIDAIYQNYFEDQIDKNKITKALLSSEDFFIMIKTAGNLPETGFDLLKQYYNEAEQISYQKLIIQNIGKIITDKVVEFLIECIKNPHEEIIFEALSVIQHKWRDKIIIKCSRKISLALNILLQKKNITDNIQRLSQQILSSLKSLPSTGDDGWLSVSEKDDSGALSLEEDPFLEVVNYLEMKYKQKWSMNSRQYKLDYKGISLKLIKNIIGGKKSLKSIIRFSLPFNFRISIETFRSIYMSQIGVKDIEIGDDTFDTHMLLSGTVSDLFIILNHKNRKYLYSLFECGYFFSFNNMYFEINFDQIEFSDSSKIAYLIKRQIELINEVIKEKTKNAFFKKNIIAETDVNVKLKIINAIDTGFFKKDIKTDEIAKTLLKDDNITVKINAAALLKNDGLKYLKNYYQESSSIKDKMLIIKKIAVLSDISAQDFILNCIKSENESIKLTAIETMNYYDRNDIIIELQKIKKMESENNLILKEVNMALKRIKKGRDDQFNTGWLSVSDKDESGALSIMDDD